MRCPRCTAPLPAVRIPTSQRQLLWGGWTCAACGAELSAHGQPLDGLPTLSLESARFVLASPELAMARRAFLAWLAAGLLLGGAGVLWFLGQVGWSGLLWAILPPVLVLLLIGARLLPILTQILRAQPEVTVSSLAIRWGARSLSPSAIQAILVEDGTIWLHTAEAVLSLTPEGPPERLVAAIEQARAVGRLAGSPEDIPEALRQRPAALVQRSGD